MGHYIGTLAIAAGAQGRLDVGAGGLSGLIIGCESGLTVKVTLEGTGTSRSLYPGTVDYFAIPSQGFNGNVLFDPVAMLSNAASYPGTYVQIDTVGLNEKVTGTYPMALPRNTNVGNAVNTLGGGASFIQNDANVAGTSIVEATVSGDSASAVSWTNTAILKNGDAAHPGTVSLDNGLVTTDGAGNLVAKQVTASNQFPGFRISTNNADIRIAGSGVNPDGILRYDGGNNWVFIPLTGSSVKFQESGGTTFFVSSLAGHTFTGPVTATNASNNILASSSNALNAGANVPAGRLGVAADGDLIDANSTAATYVKTRASGAVNFQIPNGTTIASFANNQTQTANGNGGSLAVDKVVFNIGAIKDIKAGANLAGTINHGLSGTPSAVMATCNSSPSTQTTGADTYTSTQFTMRSGASLSNEWFAFR